MPARVVAAAKPGEAVGQCQLALLDRHKSFTNFLRFCDTVLAKAEQTHACYQLTSRKGRSRMRNQAARFLAQCAATLATLMLSLILPASAQTIKVLHDFGVTASDGNLPSSPLLKDSAGNLYGMTSTGGAHNFGTVFRLSPTSTGSFNETILYSFKGGSADGALPEGSLVQDSAGNLYGVTEAGGIHATVCSASTPGCGVIFKLTPTKTGSWTETVLHRFTGTDGGNSFAGLVRDSKGNFYGATSVGGSAGLGTVYKLSLTSAGWKESVLHSFTGTPDGAEPLIFQSALTLDGLGNIYGTTYTGGAGDGGTVFELIPQTSGAWTEKILFNFQRTVFELTAANGYAKTILHNFNIFTDPAKETPHGLILDASGNIYGTTEYALYKLTHESSGWSETVLWVFGNLQDGGANTVYEPAIMDAQGHFWGATLWGGPAGAATGGTAWEVIP
jgi:uncharacterized repeat protein (TIGR03803 family)